MSEEEIVHDRLTDLPLEENPPLQKMLKLKDADKCDVINNILVNEYGRKFVFVSPKPCHPFLY